MTRMRILMTVMSVSSLILLVLYIHSTSLLSAADQSVSEKEYILSLTEPAQVRYNLKSTNSVMDQPFSPELDTRYVHQRQYARRGHVQRICEQNGLGNPATKLDSIKPSQFSRIYVDDTYKVLYCEVPKVACTNWKRILLILGGNMNTSDPEQLPAALVHSTYQQKYLRTLDTYKPRQILAKIRHYYKFMFVRNPLERIVSAYRNKFTTSYNKRYQLRIGRKIIGRYRSGANEHSLKNGNDVVFAEFVRFLLDPRTKQPFDVHWRPYYQLCHPCMVQYDFIGKYETLNEDVNFVLEELGVKALFDFPDRPNTSKTADVLKSVFSSISSEQIHNLWKLYSVDYSMFDYPYPDFIDI